MFRSNLHPLYPMLGVEQAPDVSSPIRSLLGVTRNPADTPTAGVAPPAPATSPPMAGVPTSPRSTCGTPASPSCAIPGCEITAARVSTGYCQGHHDAYLTRAFELTQDIGRGELA